MPPEPPDQEVSPRHVYVEKAKRVLKKDAAELAYLPVSRPLITKTRQEIQQQSSNQQARREM